MKNNFIGKLAVFAALLAGGALAGFAGDNTYLMTYVAPSGQVGPCDWTTVDNWYKNWSGASSQKVERIPYTSTWKDQLDLYDESMVGHPLTINSGTEAKIWYCRIGGEEWRTGTSETLTIDVNGGSLWVGTDSRIGYRSTSDSPRSGQVIIRNGGSWTNCSYFGSWCESEKSAV